MAAVIALLATTSPARAAEDPAGSKILFQVGNIYSALQSVNPDGSEPSPFPGAGVKAAFHARVSPDGRRMAFIFPQREGPARKLAVIDTDGTDMRDLGVPGVAALDWSPDGKRIAFSNEAGIGTVPASGGAIRRVVEMSSGVLNPEPQEFPAVSYSGDGTTIAFNGPPSSSSDPRSAQGVIHGVAPDGSNLRPLTPDDGTFRINPDFAPRSNRMVYEAHDSSGMLWDAEIRTANIDGSAEFTVTTVSRRLNFQPRWSPDGARIAYAVAESTEAKGPISIVAASGGPVIRLAHTASVVEWALPRSSVPKGMATIAPVKGKVLVRAKGSRKYVKLGGPKSVPLGSTVDARSGTVLVTKTGPGKRYRSTTVNSKRFVLTK